MSILMACGGTERMGLRLFALGISMTLLALAIASARAEYVALHLALCITHTLHIQASTNDGTAARAIA